MKAAAGVIVFNQDLSQVVILESKRKGNYGFPKGSQEKGESWQQTAIRELQEESGITRDQVNLIENQYVDEIKLKNGRISARYLIGRSDQQKLTAENPQEILSLKWMKIQDAFEVLNQQRKTALQTAIKLVN